MKKTIISNLAAPRLVFPNGEGTKKLTFFDILSYPNEKSYTKNFDEIFGCCCLASINGWLIMMDYLSKEDHCFLWNPDTREIIDLPPRDEDDIEQIKNSGCILLSPPANLDCTVLFVGKSFFLWWRVGDKIWTKDEYEIVRDGIKIDDYIDKVISCTDGTIYALTMQRLTIIIDREPCGKLSVRTLDFERPQYYPETLCFHAYLVESCGEIIFVVIHSEGVTFKGVNHIELFKMDFSEEAWVIMDCLGDNVIFVSTIGADSMSVSATQSGLKGNCIYFTLVQDKHNLYVFDLEDESISIYLPCPNLRTPSSLPFWLLPSNRLVEKQNVDENTTAKKELKMEAMRNTLAIIKVNVEKSERICWIDLPFDLVAMIAMHLPLAIDYMNLRCVCKTWAFSVRPIQWRVNPTGSTIEYPWLMSSNRESSRCKFLDPTCNITSHFDMPELLYARICSSKDGWLLMSAGDYSMFFFNPFTKEIVELPDLTEIFSFSGVSFSSPPTSPDCVTFGICFRGFNAVDIYFVHLEDDAWTNILGVSEARFIPSKVTPVFCNGAFYCLGQKRHLGIFDLKDGLNGWTVLCPPRPCSCIHRSYLLEYNGEILSVFVSHKGKYVHVLKLDYSNETWKTSSNLEDIILFVSRFSSIALKAVAERMQNKIYFSVSFNSENNYLFYSLQIGRWQSSFSDSFGEDLYNTKELLHCAWMQPTISWKHTSS
ncbi:hypothetical protein IFM89_018719 [Coptis chinensis]|uniref:F-box domain-containing protein n=1 Tax=Coptis chinensis TaxID=261450 RepID=A0A835IDM5_9MAGN|nr:hypothetical protein IFM89_018719 [Coptis chinensis]